MRYYYQWQTDSFLEGTTDDLRRYHMDYPPGDTQQEALINAKEHFMDKQGYYEAIALRMHNRLVLAQKRLNKLPLLDRPSNS